MALRTFSIVLNDEYTEDLWQSDGAEPQSPTNVYKPGGKVEGSVQLTLGQPMNCTGIQIAVWGRMLVGFNEDSTDPVQELSYEELAKNLERKTHVVDKPFVVLPVSWLWGTDTSQGFQGTIPAADHHFPFSFEIPPNLPSSFNGKFGIIRYWIQAFINRQPTGFTDCAPIKTDKDISVHGHFDLTREIGALMPVEESKDDTDCCLCCQGGKYGYTMTLSKKGFTSQEVLAPYFQLHNNTDSVCNAAIEFTMREIYKIGQYTLQTGEKKLFKQEFQVEPTYTSAWTPEVKLSNLPPSRFEECSHIQIEYKLKFRYEPLGCNCDVITSKTDILIGTISQSTEAVPLPVLTQPQTFIHQPIHLSGAQNAPFQTEKQPLLPPYGFSNHGNTSQWSSSAAIPTAPPAASAGPSHFASENNRPPPPSYSECVPMTILSGPPIGPPDHPYPGAQATASRDFPEDGEKYDNQL